MPHSLATVLISAFVMGACGLRVSLVSQTIDDLPELEKAEDFEDVDSPALEKVVPLTDGDAAVLEQSGMRPELERKIFGSPKTYYFIGDSLMRNQFQSACLILKEEFHEIAWPNEKSTFQDAASGRSNTRHPPSPKMFRCASGSVSFFFRWQTIPTPETVELMMKYGAPEPNVIYWDAALHVAYPAAAEYFNDTNYPVYVQKTASLYAQTAPTANLVFFLSHAVCHKSHNAKSDRAWNLCMQSHTVCPREQVVHINDMASNVLEKVVTSRGKTWSFVDGFKLTDNKCDQSVDGRHWNTFAWNELSLLMNALNM